MVIGLSKSRRDAETFRGVIGAVTKVSSSVQRENMSGRFGFVFSRARFPLGKRVYGIGSRAGVQFSRPRPFNLALWISRFVGATRVTGPAAPWKKGTGTRQAAFSPRQRRMKYAERLLFLRGTVSGWPGGVNCKEIR